MPVYSQFLRRQIPAVMAIITLPSVIQMLLPNQSVKALLLFVMMALTYWYLQEEGRVYLVGEIKNEFSAINMQHLSDENLSKDWQFYTVLASVLIGVVVGLITYNVGF